MATKEKEAMVIRYAVSEKNVLEQKHLKEQAEKKCKEAVRENEILQHKLTTYASEKNRIAQMFDNKVCHIRHASMSLPFLFYGLKIQLVQKVFILYFKNNFRY